MRVFVDTSAFFAVLDADDENHSCAADYWTSLLNSDDQPVTSNYVVVETCALLQRRLGMDALRRFCEELVPVTVVKWSEQSLHDTAVTAVLAAGRRNLSLVDCVSFAVMRLDGISHAFTLDPHFKEQGFLRLPE